MKLEQDKIIKSRRTVNDIMFLKYIIGTTINCMYSGTTSYFKPSLNPKDAFNSYCFIATFQ